MGVVDDISVHFHASMLGTRRISTITALDWSLADVGKASCHAVQRLCSFSCRSSYPIELGKVGTQELVTCSAELPFFQPRVGFARRISDAQLIHVRRHLRPAQAPGNTSYERRFFSSKSPNRVDCKSHSVHKKIMNRLFGTKSSAPKPTLEGAISNVRI